jgi:hypothetical protein
VTDKEARVFMEDWLKAKGSPLFGYADYMWILSRANGIIGSLPVSIAQAETQCGTDPKQNPYNLPGHNVWGYGYDSKVGHSYMFPTWPDCISSYCRYLAERYIYNGMDTVEEMAVVYTGNPDPSSWISNVSYWIRYFGGDPDHLKRSALMLAPPPQ